MAADLKHLKPLVTRAAKVPIVVAINKLIKKGISRKSQELSEKDLIAEDEEEIL